MKNKCLILFQIILICILIYRVFSVKEGFQGQQLFDTLMNDFMVIFPDSKRNGGGV
jgi:hypothetical protein